MTPANDNDGAIGHPMPAIASVARALRGIGRTVGLAEVLALMGERDTTTARACAARRMRTLGWWRTSGRPRTWAPPERESPLKLRISRPTMETIAGKAGA